MKFFNPLTERVRKDSSIVGAKRQLWGKVREKHLNNI
jgi:hypothetical protein